MVSSDPAIDGAALNTAGEKHDLLIVPHSGGQGDPPAIWHSLLSHAVAAPSPLNIQPWGVTLQGPLIIDLSVDTGRVLPRIDPTLRQVYLSSGAFLENLEIAAREAGFRAEISLFPSGWPGISIDPEQPVARVELGRDDHIVPDPLFSCLHTRNTNRRIYTGKEIPPKTWSALAGSFDQHLTSFGFSADPSFREDLTGYLKRAMEIQLSDADRLAEFLSHVRITSQTGNERPDGYGSAELGLNGITGWLSRMRLRMNPPGSKNRCARDLLIRLAQKQTGSAAAFGWITTMGNSRYDQVRAGRAYERVHLTAASLGLSLQSLTPILESYPGMEEPGRKFRDLLGLPDTHTVQMLFRLGYSKPGSPSGRRAVQDLVRSRQVPEGSS
jgi:hypothetical protein